MTTIHTDLKQDDKIFAALSYLWILALVPLFLKRDRPFVQFHAKQGFVLFVAEFILMLVAAIPLLGWLIWFFGWIIAVVFSILGILAALSGREWEMPWISDYVKKWKL